MTRKKPLVLVVVHDAGEAEIIGSYIIHNRDQYIFRCYALNPAGKIFVRKGISFTLLKNTPEEVDVVIAKHTNAAFALLGTGDGSNNYPPELVISWKYVHACRNQRIKTVGYLEHWIMYRERFGYPAKNWKENVPDDIWVGDHYAEKKAQKILSHRQIKFVPNMYWHDLKIEFKKRTLNRKKGAELLFLTESGPECPKILDGVLSALEKAGITIDVRVRVHPRETHEKYSAVIDKHKKSMRVFITKNKNIISDFVHAKYVVGLGSMALVNAHLCGKKVISIIAPKGLAFELPFEKIITLHSTKEFVSEL